MTILSVNLNKIALLRNSREGHRPSVLDAARDAIAAGAKGITVHPRSDQRHIRPDDVLGLAKMLGEDYPHIEFNVEGTPFAEPRDNGYPGFIQLVQQVRPHQVTLVPDSDEQLTSDHGWDLSEHNAPLARSIEACHATGARVGLFMDPVPEQLRAAADYGVERIEFYTGPYAEIFWARGEAHATTQECFKTFVDAAAVATEMGLGINAGHDLDQENLPLFATMPGLLEVSIGHAIICEALDDGFSPTVRNYVEILRQAATRV